ncbi:hypothetical protein THAOC_23546 [Thalassiosira oceanica]|uniref:Uncharacterized protein n=1 Tax=Thalassiosira oceanica TaxID=159749 RepID=K0S6L9_THAOC|nr:hypothetical protein THAOC_23546 [Thalassiosira oceanica]|eukprot:EJK56546.1 hypothetical protein THAOC_23546 [Thalassiosira oceanica]
MGRQTPSPRPLDSVNAPLAITSYHTNKTRLAEAPFGPVGDDNGPGSEPPPRNCIGIVTAFMPSLPSRRRSPAAVGKPSFPRFKVYYLPRRRVRFEPRPLDLRHRLLQTQGRTGDPKTMGTIDRAKQHRAEAAPGPDGDDNGPGSEPPPHGRFRYVSTFVTSRRRSPAAVGKPSFTYFPVDCLPHDVWRPDEPTDLRDGDLPDATPCERSEDHGPNRRKPSIGAVRLASAKMEFFDIFLPSQQFWP